MKIVFAGVVPKELTIPESNEDKFSFSHDGRRLALCDGASESFDSKLWAEVLSTLFVDDPKVGPDWVAIALRSYSAVYDHGTMSWSKQAAFERGSFATLLGVEEDSTHNSVEILAVGDSVALLISGRELVQSWPYSDPECFKQRPNLLATVNTHNNFVGQSGFWTEHGKTFDLEGLDNPILLCMTDALGEWALRQALLGGEGLSELLSVSSEDALIMLVERERAAKRMRVDDSTLIVLSFVRESEDGLPLT